MEKTLSLVSGQTRNHLRTILEYTLENENTYFCEHFELDSVERDHEFTEEQKGFIFYIAWQAWEDLGFNRGTL